MGTTKGGHIYVENPAQSGVGAIMDGTIQLSAGLSTLEGQWNILDCGKFPYVAAQQPWIVNIPADSNKASRDIRVYVASYSDDIDKTLVRYGLAGATPSVVVTLPAQTVKKPGSGSNITPYQVPSISGSVSAPVTVAGKLRRPIGVTVSMTGLPVTLPNDWAYQLLGFKDDDLTSDPILVSGTMTTDGLVPAGPDGINTPHTFGPEEPTELTSITIYAVAGKIASDHFTLGRFHYTPGSFVPNTIVNGITASCTVVIGTFTGVIDPTQQIQALLSAVFGTVGGVHDIVPLAINTARLAALSVAASKLGLASVNTANLIALAVDAAALAGSAVTPTKIAFAAVGAAAIAALAVGTAAMQSAAVTNAIIGTLAVGFGQIQALSVGTAELANLAVTNAKILSLDVSKLLAGTISVAVRLTAPTIVVTGSGYTINIDSTLGFFLTRGTSSVAISGAGGGGLVRAQNATDFSDVFPGLLSCNRISGSVAASMGTTAGYAALELIDSSGAGLQLTTAGFVFIPGGSPGGFTGTLAAAIAGGHSVIGGIIV